MTTYPSKASNVISAVRLSNATSQDAYSSPPVLGRSSSIRSSAISSTTVTEFPSVRSSAVRTSQAQSTVVRSSSAAPSASSASEVLCPSYNFTTYADDEDNNWQVLCGFDTSPSSFDVIDVSSFALCLEAVSNGGGFTENLACNSTLSNQFSAFAVNAGAFYTNSSDTSRCTGDVPSKILTNTLVQPVCSPGRKNLPILEFHGDADGPRRGYCLPSIPHWASDWSVRNGYSNAYVSTPLANGQVTKYEYGTGDNHGIVTHYKVEGWSHAWVRRAASAKIDSTPIIMDFLYRFTNPTALRFIPASPSLPAISSSGSTSGPASSTSTLASLSSPASANSTNIPLPLNTSISVAIPLTTAVSSVSLNVSSPWNTSSVSTTSTTSYLNSSTILLPGTAVSLSTFFTPPTLAPFANVTASENAALPTSPPTISCPASNGTLYRDPTTGWAFEIECNDDNTATVDLVNSSAITVNGASLQNCIRFCAMMVPTCQGVTMSGDGDICYFERSSAVRTGRIEGARLVQVDGT
ncbi:hypothetical protein E4T39_00740 [Aureobasidium subglaciale]|nr:hypothetical protein E4T39_00740 [Aureobasidium subglaciale]